MKLRDDKGHVTLWGALIFFVLSLVAVAVADVYHLQVTRAYLYQVAGEAALAGSSQGRDWTRFTATGEWALLETVAQAAAEASARGGLARRQITDYELRVVVLPEPGGGTAPGFPPVPRSSLGGGANWVTTEPAVGVYIAATVRTFFFGYVAAGVDRVTIHAFHSAGVVGR